MWSEVFILALTALLALVLRWAFRSLPREEWQMLAAVPVEKRDCDDWHGVNLTYYGLLIAVSCAFSSAVALVLMGSVGIPGRVGLAIIGVMLVVCIPMSRIVARVVEKRLHTLTIAGPAFLGIVAAPGIVWLADIVLEPLTGTRIPMLPVLAAFSVAYAMGEGLGRLACISFGCCYGKPLVECHPMLQRLLSRYGFVFSGKTKKISYESGLDGEPVVPIQAMTSSLFVGTGVVGIFLFLRGLFAESLIVTLTITQAWRIVSETLRSDYRGEGSWSAYQGLAAVAILYGVGIYFLAPRSTIDPADLVQGLGSLWDPVVILLLQVVFAATFLWTGRSTVTESTMVFRIRGRES
jgi:hypothetical protein